MGNRKDNSSSKPAYPPKATPKEKAEVHLTLATATTNELWRFMLSFVLAAHLLSKKEKTEFAELRRRLIGVATTRFSKRDAKRKVVKSVASIRWKDVRLAVNAATLLFSHSLLDAWLLEVCRLTAIVDPPYWESLVERKQVELGQVRAKRYEQLVHEKVRALLKGLERDSMLKKVDCILAQCRPARISSHNPSWRFDRAKLAELDRLRHDIVHRRVLVGRVPDALDVAFYFFETQRALELCVKRRFDLKLSANYVLIAHKACHRALKLRQQKAVHLPSAKRLLAQSM